MTNEYWRDIPGHVGRYMVSDQGRMRSLLRAGIMRQSLREDGYLQVTLTKAKGGSQSRYVHALVLLAFVGRVPPGEETRHLDGVRSNNRLSNLCYSTPKCNTADRKAHGTWPRGGKNANAKLSAEDVSVIRARHVPGAGAQLAREFGISKSQLGLIVRNKSWVN